MVTLFVVEQNQARFNVHNRIEHDSVADFVLALNGGRAWVRQDAPARGDIVEIVIGEFAYVLHLDDENMVIVQHDEDFLPSHSVTAFNAYGFLLTSQCTLWQRSGVGWTYAPREPSTGYISLLSEDMARSRTAIQTNVERDEALTEDRQQSPTMHLFEQSPSVDDSSIQVGDYIVVVPRDVDSIIGTSFFKVLHHGPIRCTMPAPVTRVVSNYLVRREREKRKAKVETEFKKLSLAAKRRLILRRRMR